MTRKPIQVGPMIIREAVIQAHMEMGSSRQAAEQRVRASDAAFPGSGLLTRIPIPSTAARKLIERMKQLFRRMDADPELRQAIADEVHRRAKNN